ncbi:DUF401 family protein [Desulforegula conservatrix]|uniref:DUF401 family protein n=1 Tax=Desulforegula conservatrix TaxID=153026 RepID=UPI00047F4671|nr:DUF401 family protein [Desulforegula conservatrix]
MNTPDYSAILRVIIVFVVMFLTIRKKYSISSVFFGGSVLLSLFFTMPFKNYILSFLSSLIASKTLSLGVIVSLIIIFGDLLEKSGSTSRMAEIFKDNERGRKIGLAAFPAIIGLLPVPGGAVFSAPMVKTLADSHKIGPSRMSLINYWYRHVWEYLWPLYPGVILASSISGMGFDVLALYMSPFTILAILIGIVYLPSGRISLDYKIKTNKNSRDDMSPIFQRGIKEISPILLVIIPVLTISPIFARIFPEAHMIRDLILMASLISGILFVIITNRLDMMTVKAAILDKRLADMILMVVSIMVFKKILEDTGAAGQIGSEITGAGIPIYLSAFFLPFLTGIVTGISVAFIGISLPVIISLCSVSGNTALIEPVTILAIASGFMGVMLSPLHLCLILSNSFFGADSLTFYKRLVPLCILIIVFTFLYFHLIMLINKP